MISKEEKKAIDNLTEYVKKDEIYNGTRENLSDFDEFCISHCTDIVIVLEMIRRQQLELEKKDKIIEEISKNPYNELRVNGILFTGGDIKQYFERKVE